MTTEVEIYKKFAPKVIKTENEKIAKNIFTTHLSGMAYNDIEEVLVYEKITRTTKLQQYIYI